MAVEAVVGEDAAKIRMAVEQHAEHVVDFALVPVGGGKDRDRRGNRRRLVGRDLDPDAPIQLGRQQLIDDLEALLALGIVDAADVGEADELALGIVAQERQRLDDARSSAISVNSS